MSHKSGHKHHAKRPGPVSPAPRSDHKDKKQLTLALVVKGDADGSEEAVCSTLLTSPVPGVALEILHKGVGDICKNDVLTAADGSSLVIGFNVGVHPGIHELCRDRGVEIRLYSVIYQVQKDIIAIAESLLPREEEETILGGATVIALFKSSRKGIILGCRVEQGRLQVGDRFRVISAMGPIYFGTIESLHIEKDAVTRATAGQEVGIKIRDFKAVKIGDAVESYRIVPPSRKDKWSPSGNILQF